MELINDFLVSSWNDLCAYPFLQRALAASLLASLTCSLLSVFVVLKKLAFIGQGISHSAFGGIAFGLWLFPALSSPDLRVYLITVAFCVLVAFCIAYTSRANLISEDSAIGIFFVSSMAMGVIMLSMRETYTTDITSYLFGKVLAVTNAEIVYLALLFLLVAAVTLYFFRDLYAYCFDTAFAENIGLPATFLHYLLLFLLSITIVLSVKVVGIILVTAFLVIPGACASQMTYRFTRMIGFSLLIGAVSAAGGIAVSNQTANLPAGATIVAIQFGFFLFLVLTQRIGKWLRIVN